MATGAVVAAMSSRRRSRLGWLSLTWTIRSLPVSRAISKVFLAVHGVEREHPAAQPQRSDQGLHRRDFVRLLVDDLMGEDDLMIDGEALRTCAALRSAKASKLLRNVFPSIAMKRDGASAEDRSSSSAWRRNACSSSAGSSRCRMPRTEV